MSSTRYPPPQMQIYQDAFDHAPMPSMKQTSSQQNSSALRPIKNAASRRNIILNPPQNSYTNSSPLKPLQPLQPSSPSRASFNNFNLIPMAPPGGPIYNTDSMQKRQPMTKLQMVPQKALFTTLIPMNKENYPQPPPPPHPSQAPYSDDFTYNNFPIDTSYAPRPSLKRSLMEAAPISETRPSKKSKTDVQEPEEDIRVFGEVPSPDSFPDIIDDGSKPSHSYAQLIGMAILRAPRRRLTLAQIYKWISETYAFYTKEDAGWQNSIRHNLSLNKAFIKRERPKDDPGKGNYWAIEPGMEHQFIKEKTFKKSSNENVPVLSTSLEPIDSDSSQPMFGSLSQSIEEELPQSQPISVTDSSPLAADEPSSDATIPASDCLTEAGGPEETEQNLPSSPLMQSSPPIGMMHSSPPVARHTSRRHDTPPPVPRFPTSSAPRSHKRKFASMDDSGYFSSLDSSAIRQTRPVGRLDADGPRIKRGRAEEEIARLRGSSYDSPTRQPLLSAMGPPTSSPMRPGTSSGKMLPPLTPAIKLKPPTRPPPSASPNTNLRIHRDKVRELVGSPIRDVVCLNEIPWSPTFDLEATKRIFSDWGCTNDFDETDYWPFFRGDGSPEKRSAKRPRLDRSKSVSILGDMTNTNSINKSMTSTPTFKFTPTLAPSAYNSPTKSFGSIDSPIKTMTMGNDSKLNSPAILDMGAFSMPHQEGFYGAEFLTEELSEFAGVDIMQGFQKIGASGNGGSTMQAYSRNTSTSGDMNGSAGGGYMRPALGRSNTSRF